LQNQILLSNLEELKEEFQEKTNELNLQNEELLDMNHYLVETAQKAEETQRLILKENRNDKQLKSFKNEII
jgi:hypothetical protein